MQTNVWLKRQSEFQNKSHSRTLWLPVRADLWPVNPWWGRSYFGGWGCASVSWFRWQPSAQKFEAAGKTHFQLREKIEVGNWEECQFSAVLYNFDIRTSLDIKTHSLGDDSISVQKNIYPYSNKFGLPNSKDIITPMKLWTWENEYLTSRIT